MNVRGRIFGHRYPSGHCLVVLMFAKNMAKVLKVKGQIPAQIVMVAIAEEIYI